MLIGQSFDKKLSWYYRGLGEHLNPGNFWIFSSDHDGSPLQLGINLLLRVYDVWIFDRTKDRKEFGGREMTNYGSFSRDTQEEKKEERGDDVLASATAAAATATATAGSK